MFRTWIYTVWRACERWSIKPPGMKDSWDAMSEWDRCLMLGYEDIRQYEEIKSAGVRL